MRTAACIAMCCAVASTAQADLVFTGAVRHVFADARLQGTGGGADQQQVFFAGDGPFHRSALALVDRGDEGFARGFASNASHFIPTVLTARAVARSQVSLGGHLEHAYASGFSIAVADFHVDALHTFTLSATIFYSGDPDVCLVKLRETGGADLFVLEAAGSKGVASLEQNIQLHPGRRYEILGLASVADLVESPFGADGSYAEYVFSFAPVPAPASCAPGLVLIVSLGMRRGEACRRGPVPAGRRTPGPANE